MYCTHFICKTIFTLLLQNLSFTSGLWGVGLLIISVISLTLFIMSFFMFHVCHINLSIVFPIHPCLDVLVRIVSHFTVGCLFKADFAVLVFSLFLALWWSANDYTYLKGVRWLVSVHCYFMLIFVDISLIAILSHLLFCILLLSSITFYEYPLNRFINKTLTNIAPVNFNSTV